MSKYTADCINAKNDIRKHLVKVRKTPSWYSSGSYKQLKPPSFKIPKIGKIIFNETSCDEDNEWFSFMYSDKDDRRNIFSYIYAMEEGSDHEDDYDSDVIIS